MRVSIIVAVSKNGVIGNENGLPWRLSEDLKHFKATTMGKPVILGRKTYESVGKPLPGRKNIVVTRDPVYQAEGCEVAHSLAEALEMASESEEAMILGGGQIYRDALCLADRIYLTRVDAEVPGDTFFPEIDPTDWREINRWEHPADERNDFACTFSTLDRVSPST